jgi:diguanylate cyclase (GGDEF)-like protein
MTQKRLRVLLAEAGPGEVAAAIRSLYAGNEQALEITTVSTVATLLPTIKVTDPEIILLDISLNLREPQDAVHLVHRTAPGVPLIVLANPSEKDEATRSLAEGAMDYLLKGSIDERTIERVLRTALERNTMTGLTDLLRDPVTGLYTRDGFLTVGVRRQEDALHAGTSLVLICALFENLQSLRDAFGPGAADRALNDLAQMMKGCCRRSDVVGRLGEAQFAILGVDAVAPSAEVMRNRLSQHLAVHNNTRSPWGPIELRTSMGSWAPQDHQTFAEFLDRVESELRIGVPAQAKRDAVLPRV